MRALDDREQPIEVSVVSGTYNRLASLQRMVDSVRQSILFPISYEIVLVDGGSTDGTIEWAKEQPDVVLIEQGTLLGAVAAFNAGFRAATGRYCVNLNDDVEVVGFSITRALAHMEDRPELGGGCFYQKRGRKQRWHTEVMGCHDAAGRQVLMNYIQTGIVPRWLGDHVGWWGNLTRTYGGDNELTANILEAGYKVEAIEGCGVMDHMVIDELREVNNPQGTVSPEIAARSSAPNPDTQRWWAKWGPGGPLLREAPTIQPPEDFARKLRFLYLPIFEPGFEELQRRTKRGLREALMDVGVVVEFDYVNRARHVGKDRMLRELEGVASAHNPDVFLAQVQSPDLLNARDVQNLRQWMPNAVFVNWNGDIRPDDVMLRDDYVALAGAFDLATFVGKNVVEKMRRRGVRAAYWQIGVEPDGVGVQSDEGTPWHDVVFLGSAPSEMFAEAAVRTEMVRRLKADSTGFGLYGTGWPQGLADGENLYDFAAGAKLYRAAKLSLGISERADEDGYFSNRLLQAMAAGGAAHLCQRFAGMEECGLADGDNLIVWDGVDDLMEKVRRWLRPENEAERGAIAERGERWAWDNHNFGVRVAELMDMLEVAL